MSKNCDVIATFPIYGQFGAIWKPASRLIVCKFYISINSNLFTKTGNRSKTSLTQLSHYCIILAKKRYFLHKSANISKVKRALVLKGIFLMKIHMSVYLRAKFEVSSITLMSFRLGRIILPPPPTSNRTPKKPTQIKVKDCNKKPLTWCQYKDDSFYVIATW